MKKFAKININTFPFYNNKANLRVSLNYKIDPYYLNIKQLFRKLKNYTDSYTL